MTLPVGTELHRIHHQDYDAASFAPGAPIDPANPGSRFAPIQSGGAFIPTFYAGNSLGVAAYERIFRGIDPAHPFKTVSMSALSCLIYSVVTVIAEIEVVRLFEPDLKKIGLTRRELIDCPESEYYRTRPWSQAIYESPITPQGMAWTSRHFDEGRAYILFGKPSLAGHLKAGPSFQIVDDAPTLEAVRKLGEIGGITIVHS